MHEVNITDRGKHDGGILKVKMGYKWSHNKLPVKYFTNMINKGSQTSCTICCHQKFMELLIKPLRSNS